MVSKNIDWCLIGCEGLFIMFMTLLLLRESESLKGDAGLQVPTHDPHGKAELLNVKVKVVTFSPGFT